MFSGPTIHMFPSDDENSLPLVDEMLYDQCQLITNELDVWTRSFRYLNINTLTRSAFSSFDGDGFVIQNATFNPSNTTSYGWAISMNFMNRITSSGVDFWYTLSPINATLITASLNRWNSSSETVSMWRLLLHVEHNTLQKKSVHTSIEQSSRQCIYLLFVDFGEMATAATLFN